MDEREEVSKIDSIDSATSPVDDMDSVPKMTDRKPSSIKPLGFIPSLPLFICLGWYILVLIFGIVCTFIPTNFTINVSQDSTGIWFVFFRMVCCVVQSWLWIVGLFGGIATFFRKELNIFYSGYTVLSTVLVALSICGFIGG